MADDTGAAVARFFEGLRRGGFADDLFAGDATFWTTTGAVDAAHYRRVPAMLRAIFPAGLAFTIGTTIVEGRHAAVEARSEGVADDGTAYANAYVFLFEVAGGRIAALKEHYNPLAVPPALAARMIALLG